MRRKKRQKRKKKKKKEEREEKREVRSERKGRCVIMWSGNRLLRLVVFSVVFVVFWGSGSLFQPKEEALRFVLIFFFLLFVLLCFVFAFPFFVFVFFGERKILMTK